MYEKIFLPINGIKQGMFISKSQTTKPVLLFIHGGPGSPEILMVDKFWREIMDEFIICLPEQRGAGISYNRSYFNEDLTLEQIVDDMKEVAEYLHTRFNGQKIFLMGHSWGSIVGANLAKKHPELFTCYIGTGQVCNQGVSEAEAFTFFKEYTRERQPKMYQKLDKMVPSSESFSSMKYQGLIRQKNLDFCGGGLFHDRANTYKISTMIKDLFFNFDGYTMGEKINFVRGSKDSLTILMHSLMDMNLGEEITELQVPFFILQGKHDYQTTYNQAMEFFNKVDAPRKEFYTFENSAHCPIFEEKEKSLEILRDIRQMF